MESYGSKWPGRISSIFLSDVMHIYARITFWRKFCAPSGAARSIALSYKFTISLMIFYALHVSLGKPC